MRVGTVEDIKGQAEWLSRIKINQLNNRALTIASKLARMIRLSNGHIVKLQDEEIAIRLAEQIFDIDSPELHTLFREFLEEALKESDKPKENIKAHNAKKRTQGLYRGVKVD